MSKVIWKYSLGNKVNCVVSVRVPSDFHCISVRIQGADFCIWGIVTNEEKVLFKNIRFAIVGTGQNFPLAEGEERFIELWKFMGSLETPADEIYHIFKDSYEPIEQLTEGQDE
jgi:hypothetical protein